MKITKTRIFFFAPEPRYKKLRKRNAGILRVLWKKIYSLFHTNTIINSIDFICICNLCNFEKPTETKYQCCENATLGFSWYFSDFLFIFFNFSFKFSSIFIRKVDELSKKKLNLSVISTETFRMHIDVAFAAHKHCLTFAGTATVASVCLHYEVVHSIITETV